jgi:predicted site-specific integrase-resolvase
MDLKLIDESRAAEILNVAVWTLRNWRRLGKGPPYIKIGGNVRYREDDLSAFVEKRLHDPEGCLQRTPGKRNDMGAVIWDRG